jgi:hypothetical protein
MTSRLAKSCGPMGTGRCQTYQHSSMPRDILYTTYKDSQIHK